MRFVSLALILSGLTARADVGSTYECISVAGDSRGSLLAVTLTHEQIHLDFADDCMGRQIRTSANSTLYAQFNSCGSPDGTAQATFDASTGQLIWESHGRAPFRTVYRCH
jgi:hypothetical protein